MNLNDLSLIYLSGAAINWAFFLLKPKALAPAKTIESLEESRTELRDLAGMQVELLIYLIVTFCMSFAWPLQVAGLIKESLKSKKQ